MKSRNHIPALRVVVAGGGTGGHVYPGVAVARRLQVRRPDTTVQFLGLKGGQEAHLVPREGFPLHTVIARPLKGHSKLAQGSALVALGIGTLQALKFFWHVRPHLVIGTGGYVMGPAMLAATVLRLPRVILEQNLVPGIAVRALARWADVVFTSFPETAAYLPKVRVEYTGTPVRQEICDIAAIDTPEDEKHLHVLICGGSQGAHRMNQTVLDALPLLQRYQQRLRIVHQTGAADYETVVQAYQQACLQAQVAPFLYDMAEHYRWAHVVICRAGATTLAELTVCGKPAILIPYPYAADDHQQLNALALQEQGVAQVILESNLTAEGLAETILALVTQPEQLRQQRERSRRLGRPQAADVIVTSCLQLLGIQAD